MRHALPIVPEGFAVVFISRTDPPAAYARFRANDALAALGAEELRFTEEESAELIRAKTRTPLPAPVIARLHEQTQGWAAGLVLYLESAGTTTPAGHCPPEEIYHYFAEELLGKTDPETERFLLRTAFLPRMTAFMAERLNGNGRAGPVLAGLVRRNYFILARQGAETVYEYHPLFRDFLLSRADERFAPEALSRIRIEAAVLLEDAGLIDDAIDLLLKAGRWADAARLACDQAPILLRQGRFRTVLEWTGRLPGDLAERNAALLYWKGLALAAVDLAASRESIRRAYRLYKEGNDVAGMLSCFPAIVDTFIFEYDSLLGLETWIEEMESLLASRPLFPSPEFEARFAVAMLAALMYRRLGHPRQEAWLGRLRSLIDDIKDPNLHIQAIVHIATFDSFSGRLAEFEVEVERLRRTSSAATPFSRIASLVPSIIHAWQVLVSHDESMRLVAQGLELGERTGVRVLDYSLKMQCAFGALTTGNLDAVEDFLPSLAPAPGDTRSNFRSAYVYLGGGLAWLKGDLAAADALIRESYALAQRGGSPLYEVFNALGLAQVRISAKKYRDAEELLRRAHPVVQGLRSPFIEFMYLVMRSQAALGRADEAKARGSGMEQAKRAGEFRRSLEKTMALGREGRFVNFPFWHPGIMARLCVASLNAGIETEYVRFLIRKRKLAPETPPLEVDAWPWPFDAAALGKFAVLLDGKPLASSGKPQKKPMDMLKVLISFGGKDVAQSAVTEALWSDAEGDVARRSFDTTLHRLRRFLGNDKSVRIEDGRLTLDHALWRVDVWTFERMCVLVEERLRDAARNADTGSGDTGIEAAVRKAVALYRGTFLPADADRPWTVSLRERLSAKFLRLISLAGAHCEKRGAWEEAKALYEAGLERDDAVEEFYQRLMLCSIRLGRKSEAVSTYNRCRAVLIRALGVFPSARTEEIFASLKSAPRR